MIKNNIALITGSSKGLGFEIAKALDNRGAQVILTGRKEANLQHALSQLKGKSHCIFALDFYDDADVNKLIKYFFTNNILPNVLIHNVGGRIDDDKFPLQETVFRKSIKINLEVAMKINESILPSMLEKQCGRIVHISSDSSLNGQASPAYVIAKAALNGYVKSAARYCAKHNIMICAVLPGILDHEGSAWDKKREMQPEHYQKKLEQMPLGRFGHPAEISNFVAELALGPSMMCAGGLFEFRGAQ